MRMLSPISNDWSWSSRRLSSPFLGDVLEDLNQFVSAVSQPSYYEGMKAQTDLDIAEAKDHFFVSFDMPGVKKDDIKIELQGDRLTMIGERRYAHYGEAEESKFGSRLPTRKFERTFVLPKSISVDKIEAQYADGVLNLILPKVAAEVPRRIQVQTGQGGLISKLLGPKKDSDREVNDVRVS